MLPELGLVADQDIAEAEADEDEGGGLEIAALLGGFVAGADEGGEEGETEDDLKSREQVEGDAGQAGGETEEGEMVDHIGEVIVAEEIRAVEESVEAIEEPEAAPIEADDGGKGNALAHGVTNLYSNCLLWPECSAS